MTYEAIENFKEALPPLDYAKLFWKQGYPIPLDLAATLTAQGYNVPALEDHYLN